MKPPVEHGNWLWLQEESDLVGVFLAAEVVAVAEEVVEMVLVPQGPPVSLGLPGRRGAEVEVVAETDIAVAWGMVAVLTWLALPLE
jgi:hypothetical protein